MNKALLEKTSPISLLLNKEVKETNNIDKTTVMVVEDDDSIRELITFSLTKNGFSVIDFNNPIKAIKKLSTEKVDIIISDVVMPEMDGIEFCSYVKKHYQNIFFIIVTGKDKSEEKIHGLNIGADEYIIKPFDFKELTARIKAAERIVNTQKQLVFLNDQLENLADTDSLTKLKNRRFFETEALKEIDRAKRYNHILSLIMIDIDKFKQINDTYGHNVGDDVLKATSRILESTMRKSDMICRYGGDEFIVLIPETSPKNTYSLSEKIRKNIEHHTLKYKDKSIAFTVSVGTALKDPTAKLSLKALVEQTDKALYRSKNSGRNKTVISKWYN